MIGTHGTTRVGVRHALLLAALLAASAFAGLTGPRGADLTGAISANDYNPDGEECAMLRRINGYRRDQRKDPLVLSEKLGAAAKHHSEDMAREDYFSHTVKGEGISWKRNIRRHGYDGSPIGENIAAGSSQAADTFDQWRRSDGHRRNMLNGDFEAIGIGRAYDRDSKYGWYWTTTFGGKADAEDRC